MREIYPSEGLIENKELGFGDWYGETKMDVILKKQQIILLGKESREHRYVPKVLNLCLK